MAAPAVTKAVSGSAKNLATFTSGNATIGFSPGDLVVVCISLLGTAAPPSVTISLGTSFTSFVLDSAQTNTVSPQTMFFVARCLVATTALWTVTVTPSGGVAQTFAVVVVAIQTPANPGNSTVVSGIPEADAPSAVISSTGGAGTTIGLSPSYAIANDTVTWLEQASWIGTATLSSVLSPLVSLGGAGTSGGSGSSNVQGNAAYASSQNFHTASGGAYSQTISSSSVSSGAGRGYQEGQMPIPERQASTRTYVRM